MDASGWMNGEFESGEYLSQSDNDGKQLNKRTNIKINAININGLFSKKKFRKVKISFLQCLSRCRCRN